MKMRLAITVTHIRLSKFNAEGFYSMPHLASVKTYLVYPESVPLKTVATCLVKINSVSLRASMLQSSFIRAGLALGYIKVKVVSEVMV